MTISTIDRGFKRATITMQANGWLVLSLNFRGKTFRFKSLSRAINKANELLDA